MELKSYKKSQVQKAFDYLLDNARNKSNATKAGERSKPSAREDGLSIDDITGYSIQYTMQYNNYLVYIFHNNKSYGLKIKQSKLPQWLSVLASLPSIYEDEDIDLDDLIMEDKVIEENEEEVDEFAIVK